MRFKITSGLQGMLITLVLSTLTSLPLSGANPLFTSESMIRMELRTDFSAIQAERTGTPSYHDGKLIYRPKGGEKLTLSVKVMARGNFRLNPANCDFPPLMIDFKKKEVENTIFENQKKLKLVTPCQTEEDVIDEYMIYKMYNQVTDMSLKVRLVRISYFDDGTGKKLFDRYSFFIEDKDQAAVRNNATIKAGTINSASLNRESYLKLAVFQYMIGNIDWHVELRKNIRIIQLKGAPPELYAVPYDFDFSAFVNAEYSKHHGIPEDILVERRKYLGSCYNEKELHEVFEFYREMKPVFESIIKEQKLLSREDRLSVLEYVNKFYAIISNGDNVKKQFLGVCEMEGTEAQRFMGSTK